MGLLIGIVWNMYGSVEGWEKVLNQIDATVKGVEASLRDFVSGLSFAGWNAGDWLTLLFTFASVLLAFWQVLRNEGMQPAQSVNIKVAGRKQFPITDEDGHEFQNLTVSVGAYAGNALRDVSVPCARTGRSRLDPEDAKPESMYLDNSTDPITFTLRRYCDEDVELIIRCIVSSPIRRRPVANGWKFIISKEVNKPHEDRLTRWKWYRTAWIRHLVNEALHRTPLRFRLHTGKFHDMDPYWKSELPDMQAPDARTDHR